MNTFKIVSFGEVLWDKFPDYKKPGGSPANLAYHLHTFGNESLLISRVGNDDYGNELIRFLVEKELPIEHVQIDHEYPTGIVTVTFDKNKEPSYLIHKPAAWDYISPTENFKNIYNDMDAICFASLSQRNRTSSDTLNTILNSVRSNCLKVFDLNLRPPFINKEEILKKIDLSDVIKMNEEEYKTVGSWLNSSDTADTILNNDPDKKILLTMGAKGSALFTSKGHAEHKAYPIDNDGDFVGVGDAFLACFTHLTLKQTEPNSLLERSNRYAAYIASQKGSMPTVPDEILNLIRV
ncbi:MAG: carbohydrate kinase [Balneolaceae bacterium]